MKKRLLLLASMGAWCLAGCAGIDRDSAKALGNAGFTAAQAVQQQSDAASKTLSSLPEWWGVRDALVCANIKAPDIMKACLDNVRKQATQAQPDTALGQDQNRLVELMAKRAKAAGALRDAYQSFVNLASYDAGAEAESALKAAFGAINDFSAAASAISPAGAALPAIASGFASKASTIGGFLAAERQQRLMLDASQDLHRATDAFIAALSVERDKAASESLLATLRTEQDTVYSAFVQSGLISPKDALTPLLHEIAPGAQIVSLPPGANLDAINTASVISLHERSKRQQKAVVAAYDAALAALKALSAQHARLEAREPLDLATILGEARNVKAILADLQGK
ncbi:hypothetical protein [Chromobacterium alticapitis]|nr:hypothetical protein [Chromobacterium alticapitis]